MNKSDIQYGVREISLDSWKDFFDLNMELFVTSPAYIYRGQTNYDWPLRSTIDRLLSLYPRRKVLGGGSPEYLDRDPLSEEEHLKAFKHTIRGLRGPNPSSLDDDEAWALGQHHRLATPLLDWTRSPFLSLFFAFEEKKCFLADDQWGEPKYRGVYVLSSSTIETIAKDDTPSVRLFSPKNDANYRSISQAAVFIRLSRGTDLETYVTERVEENYSGAIFTKIKIPNADRDACLVALNKMNINHSTLFPDIDGAAKYVNSLWCPGHEDSIAYI